MPLAILAAATVLLVHWIRSEQCRALLQQRTEVVLHARTDFAPLDWHWLGVNSARFSANGHGDSALRRIEASCVRASLNPSSLLQGVWGVNEISMDDLQIHLGSPETKSPGDKPAAPSSPTAPPSSSLPKWVPSLVVVDVIHGKKTDLFIETGPVVVTLLGTALEARPDSTGDETLFKLSGGALGCTRYPDLNLSLKTARCRLTPKGLDLAGGDFTAPLGGTIRINGMFPSDGTPSTLSATWEKFPVAALLPRFADRVTGMLAGSGTMHWGAGGHREGSGTIRGEGITVTGIPGFVKLAELTGLEQFRHLPVQTFSATVSIHDNITEWRDILFESQGFIKITGETGISLDGSLDGAIRLGITTRIVNMIPFARELLGLDEREGYVWIREPILLSGTLGRPVEDFSPRLTTMVAAGAEGMVRKGIGTGLGALGIKTGVQPCGTNSPTATPLPSNATNAVKTMEQGAGAVLDTLGGFLK